jgi:hypothetical protein
MSWCLDGRSYNRFVCAKWQHLTCGQLRAYSAFEGIQVSLKFDGGYLLLSVFDAHVVSLLNVLNRKVYDHGVGRI